MPLQCDSGITKSGRVWRKVPESDAQSVHGEFIYIFIMHSAEIEYIINEL